MQSQGEWPSRQDRGQDHVSIRLLTLLKGHSNSNPEAKGVLISKLNAECAGGKLNTNRSITITTP